MIFAFHFDPGPILRPLCPPEKGSPPPALLRLSPTHALPCPPLLTPFSSQGGYRATGGEAAEPLRSGEVSVGNALRLALTSILRSRTDTRWGEREGCV